MVVIASTEVARNVCEETYGLVFALNTFLGAILEAVLFSICTYICKFNIEQFFLTCGAFYELSAVGFFINGFFECVRQKSLRIRRAHGRYVINTFDV